ncbi:DUF5784 family protein [Haloarculaceae archaeon H-GB2-1]|nr:DUF5784 family protein [Haloarculaceae archaeon H-GB1-1]MEA5388986.1 DUF5784 family protein [Haloarculaceae archaeon H-GB11]MEA5407044.1 DUF5784 family protein [Haloarculaceae archaeon H-GB2-1]
MAGPLRFRRSSERWTESRVQSALLKPLDQRFGATMTTTWYKLHGPYETRRLEMDNGDLALFAWSTPEATGSPPEAYWLGNTETPETLWRTDKYTFDEVSDPISEWAERELFAQLEHDDPWLAANEHLTRFFLPVFCSKDGRDTTREFFREHASGFPDADRDDGLAFYDRLMSRGLLDDHRYTMAAKLGTSERLEVDRMCSTMAEFNAAKLLADAGHDFVPEVEMDSGHALDFRVGDTLVEVTRPKPPRRRNAGTPQAAVRQTVGSKTSGQLDVHDDAFLLVDCTSFRDDEWNAVRAEQPAVGHEPTVVFRMRPDDHAEGYAVGDVPLDLGGGIRWV